MSAFVIGIPARRRSTRLADKLLLPVAGLPLLAHAIRAARAAQPDRLVVAVDDADLAAIAREHGAEVLITAPELPSGTDRLAAAAQALELPDQTRLVNLQADEPLVPVRALTVLAEALAVADEVVTLAEAIGDAEELARPSVVKVVRRLDQRALYFSRAAIPHDRDGNSAKPCGHLRHIGLYGYRVGRLKQLAALPTSALEGLEALEQLRWLDHGVPIRVIDSPEHFAGGVDVAADVPRIEAALVARTRLS